MSTTLNAALDPLILRARLVEDCLRSHEATFADNPGFLAQREHFRHLLERATAADPGSEVSGGGTTRDALAQALRIVSGPLEAWAAVIGDEPLRLLAGACPESWTLRGNGLRIHARAVLDMGRDVLAQGAGQFGLSPFLLDALEARLEACEAMPDGASDPIRELESFRRAVMDPLVRLYLERAPRFCAAYRTACREIPAKHLRGTAGGTGAGKNDLRVEEMLSS